MRDVIAGIGLALILSTLFGCSGNLTDEQVIQIKNAEASGSGWDYDAPVIHKEEVEKGVLAFFREDGALSTGFMEKTLFGWRQTLDRAGGGMSLPGKDISAMYAPLIKDGDWSPFPMLFGLVENEEIKEIHVSYRSDDEMEELEAEVVHEEGLWFVFVEEPDEVLTYTIRGYAEDGDLLEAVKEEAVILPDF
ncbi:hypothetical protein LCM20_16515 [Halobacillus litoralis]|uniref:hypothetical protein n=1 Tax=Halobacillus litoralis TaxID=45668 RepID=UPI001CD39729|nr:hypothetical protein [Halobacillus litoralis]MCA0972213.1 hypothetical protein [Halobacillus litoralis]